MLPTLRSGLLTAASSRLEWKSLCNSCFDRVSMQTRREAPEVGSHARKRVVTDYMRNRGAKRRK